MGKEDGKQAQTADGTTFKEMARRENERVKGVVFWNRRKRKKKEARWRDETRGMCCTVWTICMHCDSASACTNRPGTPGEDSVLCAPGQAGGAGCWILVLACTGRDRVRDREGRIR